MSEISFKEINALCLVTTQQIVDGLGWDTIVVTVLNDIDEARLTAGLLNSRLNWAWAIYGFAPVWYDHSKVSAEVTDILHYIRLKIVNSA